jgi:hypothetical protein
MVNAPKMVWLSFLGKSGSLKKPVGFGIAKLFGCSFWKGLLF